jgi:hypothetical protein
MRFSQIRSWSLLAAISLMTTPLTGCPDREVAAVDIEQIGAEGHTVLANNARQLDLLFVIDNSGSMTEEQESLANNFVKFINVLKAIPGGLPDLHLAVVTSDMGNNGSAQVVQKCERNGQNGEFQTGGIRFANSARFLIDERDPTQPTGGSVRRNNYAADPIANGDLTNAFSAMARVGTNGCGFEQHLGATKAALIGNQVNSGFLRKNALLAIVFIADEDDCSVSNNRFFNPPSNELGPFDNFRCTEQGVTCGPDAGFDIRNPGSFVGCRPNTTSTLMSNVGTLVSDIRSLKAFPDEQILVAGIFGPATPFKTQGTREKTEIAPSCTYNKPNCTVTATESCKQNAAPSIRLSSFVQSFAIKQESTICKEDLSDALTELASSFVPFINKECFQSSLLEPVSCVVTDVLNPGAVKDGQTLLDQCNPSKSNTPCWRAEKNPTACAPPKFSGDRMVLERGNIPLPENALTTFECETKY